EFGKEIYNQLLQLAENEDWGDYTDVSEGRDFDLIAVKGEVGGRKDAIKTSIQIKPKQTPLSKDAKLVKKWLEEQPDILEIQKTFKMSFEKLKGLLEKFISPED